MEVKYEIRVRKVIYSIYCWKYFWKIVKLDTYGEEVVTSGYEDTLDLAYKQAKSVYEELAK